MLIPDAKCDAWEVVEEQKPDGTTIKRKGRRSGADPEMRDDNV